MSFLHVNRSSSYVPRLRLTPSPAPIGDWLWSVDHGRYRLLPQSPPIPRLELHPLERHDHRLEVLACGGRISLPRPSFQLWDYRERVSLVDGRRRLRGRVARAVDGWDVTGTPTLYLDGEPWALLRNIETSIYTWMRRWVDGERRSVRFTTTGGDLWRLVGVNRTAEGEVVIDLREAPLATGATRPGARSSTRRLPGLT